MILVPAYSRDYKTAAEVRKDWETGKDFKICDISCQWNGCYTSIRDYIPNLKMWEHSYIRYDRLGELTHIGKWEEREIDE
jgi:hypothetical protein